MFRYISLPFHLISKALGEGLLRMSSFASSPSA